MEIGDPGMIFRVVGRFWPQPVSMTVTTASAPASACRSCAGVGWKYTTHRTALRMVAQSCRDARLTARRSCMDCVGRGTLVATAS
jgi:DnaJ-class molecular chaperone